MPKTHKLMSWVSNQRVYKDKLKQEERDKLNKVGFVWDAREFNRNVGYKHLIEYIEEYGNAFVPDGFKSKDGFPLDNWIDARRVRRRNNDLTKQEIKKLDKVGFVWDVHKYKWDQGYNNLLKYIEKYGNAFVPQNYTIDDYPLGNWVSSKRRRRKNNGLTKQEIKKLDKVGFIWNVINYKWDQGYNNLLKYIEQYGDANVPKTFINKDGYPLGSWVNSQRNRKNKLKQEAKDKLDKVGFKWWGEGN